MPPIAEASTVSAFPSVSTKPGLKPFTDVEVNLGSVVG
jgi:hypothetical protein